jgi:hypothetical protein
MFELERHFSIYNVVLYMYIRLFLHFGPRKLLPHKAPHKWTQAHSHREGSNIQTVTDSLSQYDCLPS